MSTSAVCMTGSKLACMSNKVGKIAHAGLFALKQHSPEILTFIGISGIIGASVMACRATYLKADKIVAKHKELMSAIDNAQVIVENGDSSEEYNSQDILQDKILAYFDTAKSFVSLYGPSVAVGALSIAFLVGANKILRNRNIALVSAYTLIQNSFRQYRDRVVEELGEEKDFHFQYGTEYETVSEEVTDETGKTKKVKKQIQVLKGNGLSMYSRLFDEQILDEDGNYTGSSQWSPVADYNIQTLILKNAWANEQLQARGYLFLNDVYENLGFPRTKAGQVVGWKFRKDGYEDAHVSFGPEVDAFIKKNPTHLMAYKDGSPIVCDFNVDGVILDEIE